MEFTKINYVALGMNNKEQIGGKDLTNSETQETNLKDGLSYAELEAMDKNQDGYVTENEFKTAMKNKALTSETKQLWGSYLSAFNELAAEKTTVNKEKAAEILDNAQKSLDDIFKLLSSDVLGGDEMTEEVIEKILTELDAKFQKSSSINVGNFVNEISKKHNFSDNLQNAIEEILSIINGNDKLTKQDIGNAALAYAVFSGINTSEIPPEIKQMIEQNPSFAEEWKRDSFSMIIDVLQNNNTIEKQADAISELGINSSYNNFDIRNILSAANTDSTKSSLSSKEQLKVGEDTLTKSLQNIIKVNNAVLNAQSKFDEVLDLLSDTKLDDSLKENLMIELKAKLESKSYMSVNSFVKEFKAKYDLNDTLANSITKTLNAINYNGNLTYSDIGKVTASYAVLSGAKNKNDVNETNLKNLITEFQKTTNIVSLKNKITGLGIELNYNSDDITRILQSINTDENKTLSNNEHTETGSNVLDASINALQPKVALDKAQSKFGNILGKLGVTLSLELTKTLETELQNTLKKGNISDINNWVSNFVKNNNIDTTAKNALNNALNTIASNDKKLTFDDIGKAASSFAIFSNLDNNLKTKTNLVKIIQILQKTSNISEQLSQITKLKLFDNYEDVETILNSANTDSNNKTLSNKEFEIIGKNTLTKSIERMTTAMETKLVNGKEVINGLNGVNGVFDEDFFQGGTGDCGLISGLIALDAVQEGRNIIKDAITLNGDGSVTVNFKGVDVRCTITEDEILANDREYFFNKSEGAYSSGDNDVLILELAIEKAIKNDLRGTWHSEVYDYLDAGLAVSYENSKEGIDKMLNDKLNNDNLVIGFALYTAANGTLTDGHSETFAGNHAYAVTKVTKSTVSFKNPWYSNKEYTMTWNSFKNFGISNFCITDLTPLPEASITKKEALNIANTAKTKAYEAIRLYTGENLPDDLIEKFLQELDKGEIEDVSSLTQKLSTKYKIDCSSLNDIDASHKLGGLIAAYSILYAENKNEINSNDLKTITDAINLQDGYVDSSTITNIRNEKNIETLLNLGNVKLLLRTLGNNTTSYLGNLGFESISKSLPKTYTSISDNKVKEIAKNITTNLSDVFDVFSGTTKLSSELKIKIIDKLQDFLEIKPKIDELRKQEKYDEAEKLEEQLSNSNFIESFESENMLTRQEKTAFRNIINGVFSENDIDIEQIFRISTAYELMKNGAAKNKMTPNNLRYASYSINLEIYSDIVKDIKNENEFKFSFLSYDIVRILKELDPNNRDESITYSEQFQLCNNILTQSVKKLKVS